MPKGQKVCRGNNKKCGHPNGPNAKTCAKCKTPFPVSSGCKLCENCGIKAASFGLPGEGKKRQWCGGCANGQAGAVNMTTAARSTLPAQPPPPAALAQPAAVMAADE